MASSVAGEAAGNSSNVLVQYVVLRRDLIDTWPLGSVVTQGCHASVAAIWSHKDDAHTPEYCSTTNIHSMHKVTLEVKGEPQIQNLSEKLTAGGIAHKLWIEQPENIHSCLATKPYPKFVDSTPEREMSNALKLMVQNNGGPSVQDSKARLNGLGWGVHNSLHKMALGIFCESASYREAWMILDEEEIENWVMMAARKLGYI